MWEINLSHQLLSFLYAVLTGMLFCVVYDFFKAFRLTFNSSAVIVFFQDIIYFSIISVIAFIFFLIFTGGEIRSFILMGFLLGFIVWRITVSRVTAFLIERIFLLIKRFFDFVNRKILEFFGVLGRFSGRHKTFLKNIQNRVKKLLKTSKGLLYTKQE